jgi:molybdenum cofactor cytidylyltransferase
MTDRIAAIILAAGSASRMGQPKQLLDWDGRPLVRVVAEHALAARLDCVLVVVGAAGDRVAAALADLPVELVENPAYDEGQSTSLRAGIAALGRDIGAALVLLGDQPFVSPEIMERIVDEWRASGAAIVAPVYRGQRGNPVLFAHTVFGELLAIEGDQGARAILFANPARVRTIAFDDDRPLADIDTPEDYKRLQSMKCDV